MSRSSHSPRDSHPRVSPLAANLARWASQPLWNANRRAIVWTGLMMLLIVVISSGDPHQAAFVRSVALVATGANGLLHIFLRRMLVRWRDRGVREAGLALRVYLSPRRISNLDLAMAWLGLAAAVSLYRAILAVPVGTG